MASLDQSFIKAFSHDTTTPIPAPATPTTAPPAGSRSGGSGSGVSTSSIRSRTPLGRIRRAFADDGLEPTAASTPAPHIPSPPPARPHMPARPIMPGPIDDDEAAAEMPWTTAFGSVDTLAYIDPAAMRGPRAPRQVKQIVARDSALADPWTAEANDAALSQNIAAPVIPTRPGPPSRPPRAQPQPQPQPPVRQAPPTVAPPKPMAPPQPQPAGRETQYYQSTVAPAVTSGNDYARPAAYAPAAAYVPPPARYLSEVTGGGPIQRAAVGLLRPLLEVDRLNWPEIVDTVLQRAASHLGSLVDALLEASTTGQKVIMLLGEQDGAGASTIAIASAKRLADLGLRVALVDGDWKSATLASALGVAAQMGWEDVLTHRASLADVLVESLVDRITLLPMAGPIGPQIQNLDVRQPANDLEELRDNFDIVLIDGGTLPDNGQAHLLHVLQDSTLDGTILVRDVRQLHEGARILAHPLRKWIEGLQMGVVENFVGA